MGSKALRLPEALGIALEQVEVLDDFNYAVTADTWTIAVAANGTLAHEGDAAKSRLKFFSTTVNDGAVLKTTHELFKFISGKAMKALGVVNGADVNTDDGVLFFGWANALAVATLADTTGALTATDACGFYKAKDSNLWAFHTEINGTALTTTSTTASLTGADQVLEIDVTVRNATQLECRPKVNGEQLKDANGVKIMHVVTLGTATEMNFGMVTKGIHADDWNVYLDLAYASQIK